MSPTRSCCSASHAVALHDWLLQKLGSGPPERQDKEDTICTVPVGYGTPHTRRLYPFGAQSHHHSLHHIHRHNSSYCRQPMLNLKTLKLLL